MRKRKIQAGLLILSVIFLTITAGAGTGRRSHAFDLSMKPDKDLRQEIYSYARDYFYEYIRDLDSRVTVTRSAQKEDFFETVYMRLEELGQRYPDSDIFCYVNMATLLDGVVEVENEGSDGVIHYLYIGNGNIFYEFQGDMDTRAWRSYLQDVLYPLEVTIDGRHVLERSFGFGDAFYPKDLSNMYIYFGDIEVEVCGGEHILSANGVKREDASGEFYLCFADSYDERIHTVTVRATEALPEYETAEEMRNYFLTCYPEMIYYSAHPVVTAEGKDTYYYVIQEAKVVRMYFDYGGQSYEVTDEIEGDDYLRGSSSRLPVLSQVSPWSVAGRISRGLGYDTRFAACLWKKAGQGLEYESLVWEEEPSNRNIERCYHVGYSQRKYDEDGIENGVLLSRLYVLDDDDNWNFMEWEGQSPCTEILWDVSDGKKAYIIRYEDGTEIVYNAAGLLPGRDTDLNAGGEGS